MAKATAQLIVSLAMLGGGLYIIATIPELRAWGTAIIGLVVGYWLR